MISNVLDMSNVSNMFDISNMRPVSDQNVKYTNNLESSGQCDKILCNIAKIPKMVAAHIDPMDLEPSARDQKQAVGLLFSVELLEIKVVENVLIGPIPLQAQKSNSQKHEFDANSARVLIPGF